MVSLWREYIENGDHKIIIGMPGPGKRMTLTWENTGDVLEFSGRAACLRWLLASCPDADVWGGEIGGVTTCAGSVRGLAERAGIRLDPSPLFSGGAH